MVRLSIKLKLLGKVLYNRLSWSQLQTKTFFSIHWEVTYKAPIIKLSQCNELLNWPLLILLLTWICVSVCGGLRVWLGVASSSHLARSSLLSASEVTLHLHQISDIVWFIFPCVISQWSYTQLHTCECMWTGPNVHCERNFTLCMYEVVLLHASLCLWLKC